MENKDELMEEKIVEIGEYTVRIRLEEDSIEVVVLDALGEEIEGIHICDDDGDSDEFDDEDDFDDFDEESEGDDEDGDFDDDNYE